MIRPVREDMTDLILIMNHMRQEIPQYLIREWHSHLKRIVNNVSCDPSDSRTANALRLARKDLRRMEQILNPNDTR